MFNYFSYIIIYISYICVFFRIHSNCTVTLSSDIIKHSLYKVDHLINITQMNKKKFFIP